MLVRGFEHSKVNILEMNNGTHPGRVDAIELVNVSGF
jgi:hypothetical protein